MNTLTEYKASRKHDRACLNCAELRTSHRYIRLTGGRTKIVCPELMEANSHQRRMSKTTVVQHDMESLIHWAVNPTVRDYREGRIWVSVRRSELERIAHRVLELVQQHDGIRPRVAIQVLCRDGSGEFRRARRPE